MNLFQAIGLDRFNPAQGGVRGMRVVASGLLVIMAGLYLLARSHEAPGAAVGWGYLRAFAEAAMVGGLADWFAVTALFRHPLGLPIPHTAIIPRNKDRIGDSLAAFLRVNFLTASVVARRMYRVDAAGALGRLLAHPPQGGRTRAGIGRALATILESLGDDRFGAMVKGALASRLRGFDLAPLLGRTLDAAIVENRHAEMLDGLIGWASRILLHNEGMIHEMVQARTGKFMRWTGLDEKLSTAIVEGLHKLLDDMATDPHHPLRLKAQEGMEDLAHKLQHDPATRAKVAQIKGDLIDSPAVAAWLDTLWQGARLRLIDAARDPNAALGGQVGEALKQLGATLQSDPRLRATFNRFARRMTVGLVADYGDGIVKLVSETIRGWDARTVTHQLENAVGRDLQYIRVNGTLVGGLIGIGLHAIGQFI
ncbi:DUF445 family protein [Sphingomonas histidinilytica]|jgi:uncharacterized membrane-anchored protein YjiN (DUF445 family)|uniref:Uncharacterized membrane-anchored protein YjiN, DUF445 family n=1 Tax=Rhizorhabdus histidinilytica TaxID=439228 RepID=A0A1T4ZRN2_9SPHN|nr:DUF445 domain-containing protein [Rhizorhabdus histidinilytica]MBO9379809.1 DUF445 family protein [Rhizorhabdus histidinilytica]QEH78727.1 DUF445 domain-containing protein [Sphingomonas sp. C8-2]SKB25441.1 Uncharacterized membrane-anchored protein YjiN, DUF445 family [Rhizorhabdus histidinilytica]